MEKMVEERGRKKIDEKIVVKVVQKMDTKQAKTGQKKSAING